MDLDKLNEVCFTVCIVCIIAGVVLTLAMIWAELYHSEFVWKCWLTLGTFFAGAALTMSVNKTLAWRRRDRPFGRNMRAACAHVRGHRKPSIQYSTSNPQ